MEYRMAADPQMFKDIMSHWASGISIITTAHQGEWFGFTASSFASVSIDPLLISMSMTKTLRSYAMISASRVFTVNILRRDHLEWAKIFAGMIPEKQHDRFEGIDCVTDLNGCPILPDTMGYVSCEVYRELDVGPSILILGEVKDIGIATLGKPLIYYHRQWGDFTAFE
jgi:3-hydroxy-9,10-secoandrosta-1,3,5(10)-triene-9,17-dione monooxygenase reductase component